MWWVWVINSVFSIFKFIKVTVGFQIFSTTRFLRSPQEHIFGLYFWLFEREKHFWKVIILLFKKKNDIFVFTHLPVFEFDVPVLACIYIFLIIYCFLIKCVSAWYNHTGWLVAKNQVTSEIKKKVFHSFWSTEPMLQNVVQWLMFNACAVSHEGLSEWNKICEIKNVILCLKHMSIYIVERELLEKEVDCTGRTGI